MQAPPGRRAADFWVCTSPGANDLVNFGPLVGTTTPVSLPTCGAMIYVRLGLCSTAPTYSPTATATPTPRSRCGLRMVACDEFSHANASRTIPVSSPGPGRGHPIEYWFDGAANDLHHFRLALPHCRFDSSNPNEQLILQTAPVHSGSRDRVTTASARLTDSSQPMEAVATLHRMGNDQRRKVQE